MLSGRSTMVGDIDDSGRLPGITTFFERASWLNALMMSFSSTPVPLAITWEPKKPLSV